MTNTIYSLLTFICFAVSAGLFIYKLLSLADQEEETKEKPTSFHQQLIYADKPKQQG
jgi:hypothetical protein